MSAYFSGAFYNIRLVRPSSDSYTYIDIADKFRPESETKFSDVESFELLV